MIVIVLENRQPVKTLAWIQVLAFLPVLGLVIYFFFGRDRRRDRLISKTCSIQLARRSVSCFYQNSDPDIPLEHFSLVRLFHRQSIAFPYPGNQVEIYTHGPKMLNALLADMETAKHHVHLESYIIEDDDTGRLIMKSLSRCVERGVEVRVIYDDVGCWNVPNRFFKEMQEKGIQVYGFLPVRFPKLTSKVNYRNHRKIVVIDRRIGYVGGMNLADRYFKKTEKYTSYWRDTHLRLVGSAVSGLQRAFLADWYVASKELLTDGCYYPEAKTDSVADIKTGNPETTHALVQIVTSIPTGFWPDIMQGMILAVHKAKKYCYIQSPYFMPTDRLLFALQTVALAGVDVRLMLPEWADKKFLTWASRSYLFDVMRAGVRVYLYQNGFLHAKTWVIDDSLVSCGSTNMDFRSFEHNFEVNAFIYDKKVALSMKKIFKDDQKKCRLLNLNAWAERSRWRHLLESFIRLLTPLL